MKHVLTSKSFFLFAVTFTLLMFTSGESATAASLQNVACPAKGQPNIELFDQNGTHLGIRVLPFEVVTVFQGWGKNEIQIKENKVSETLVRIQVPGRKALSTQSFFLQKGAVASLAQCEQHRGEKAPMATPVSAAPTAVKEARAIETVKLPPSTVAAKPAAQTRPVAPMKPVAKVEPKKNNANDDSSDDDDEGDDGNDDGPVQQATVSVNGAGGLTNFNCCGFPVKFPKNHPPNTFLHGQAQFGWRRRHGKRVHGGDDIYGKLNQPVYAVTDGEVVRAPYIFTKRVLAIDVRHKGGFFATYGEFNGRSFGMRLHGLIKKGQQVGAMGKVPGAPAPMLHFELYKGTSTGQLHYTHPHGPYWRRDDLVNPTQYLLHWEKNQS